MKFARNQIKRLEKKGDVKFISFGKRPKYCVLVMKKITFKEENNKYVLLPGDVLAEKGNSFVLLKRAK